MMTIKEMSELTGVSARALRYYDEIGLFHPTGKSEAGYRLYDEDALSDLQQILYFRELDIPLNTIKEIMVNPDLDRNIILIAQKMMLTAEKERLERLIISIDEALKGANTMDFTVFSREETTNLFNMLFEQMPAEMRDAAIKEFGSVEEWKEHYLKAVSSDKVRKQYGKVVEWYGNWEVGMDTAETDAVDTDAADTDNVDRTNTDTDTGYDGARHSLGEQIRISYKRRIDHILDKLSAKRSLDVNSFEIRELIGEYGFVLKQLFQIKDEKEMMLSQAKVYLNENARKDTDNRYGEGFAEFLNQAITAFYER